MNLLVCIYCSSVACYFHKQYIRHLAQPLKCHFDLLAAAGQKATSCSKQSAQQAAGEDQSGTEGKGCFLFCEQQIYIYIFYWFISRPSQIHRYMQKWKASKILMHFPGYMSMVSFCPGGGAVQLRRNFTVIYISVFSSSFLHAAYSIHFKARYNNNNNKSWLSHSAFITG